MASLGEKIRARRKELGLTQSQLGGTELTKGFISLVEKGRAKPSLETLLLLAQRLQAPVGYFLEESPPCRAPRPARRPAGGVDPPQARRVFGG